MPNCMSSRELGTVDLLWLLIAYMN